MGVHVCDKRGRWKYEKKRVAEETDCWCGGNIHGRRKYTDPHSLVVQLHAEIDSLSEGQVGLIGKVHVHILLWMCTLTRRIEHRLFQNKRIKHNTTLPQGIHTHPASNASAFVVNHCIDDSITNSLFQ